MAIGPHLEKFSPPGYLDDFTEDEKAHWSNRISEMFQAAITGNKENNNGPRLQFFHLLENPVAKDAQTKVITWSAFPKKIAIRYPGEQRFKEADLSRSVQDEYCEWTVERNDEGKIIRVTFTCEARDYWLFLADRNKEKLLSLYKKDCNSDVELDDLLEHGEYKLDNDWNKQRAMHLMQHNNTLHDEIELAACASTVRTIEGRAVEHKDELIALTKYGIADRNSDPAIGQEINFLARQGAKITLRDPIGIYLDCFDPVGWTTDDGSDPRTFWKITRGTEDAALRAVFEVKDRNFGVEDIKICGRPIKYGSQIAEYVRVKLVALAHDFKMHYHPVEGPVGSARRNLHADVLV
ncbi:MAG: hypothetical protein ACHQUC_01465 [Chlamydiales bacterium]